MQAASGLEINTMYILVFQKWEKRATSDTAEFKLCDVEEWGRVPEIRLHESRGHDLDRTGLFPEKHSTEILEWFTWGRTRWKFRSRILSSPSSLRPSSCCKAFFGCNSRSSSTPSGMHTFLWTSGPGQLQLPSSVQTRFLQSRHEIATSFRMLQFLTPVNNTLRMNGNWIRMNGNWIRMNRYWILLFGLCIIQMELRLDSMRIISRALCIRFDHKTVDTCGVSNTCTLLFLLYFSYSLAVW